MRATALAHPNIALIKYWGKRDERLALPATGSLSLTLDLAATRTTVVLDENATSDETWWDGATGPRRMSDGEAARVSAFLDLLRERAGRREHAVVTTRNEIPTGAGLASSASGFAALATAAAHAYGLELDGRELSRLARRGSGSASRSIFGGLVVWHAGTDDATSYAEPIDSGGLDLGLVVVVLTEERKAVGSREAMRRTVATSPFFSGWVESVPSELAAMRAAIDRADLTAVGELAEANALRMHATMLGATPPVRYWSPETLRALDVVAELRSEGVEAYATIDAGPNVKVLCRRGEAASVARRIETGLGGAGGATSPRLLVSGPGEGARLVRDEEPPA